MRLHVLSDIHLEFGPFQLPHLDVDCLILAGDIHTKKNGVKWLKSTYGEKIAIYILGNHEFYGEKFPQIHESQNQVKGRSLIKRLKDETRDSNIHILENEYLEISGYKIFGCTLWTDMALYGDVEDGCEAARHIMTDYQCIRILPTYRKLIPYDTIARHRLSRSCLENFLQEYDPRKSIIVTHHAPSMSSLPLDRRNELISCAYVSDLEELILKYRPRLWIHGHVHNSVNYKLGETQIIANPRGYCVYKLNRTFIPDYVIQI